MTNPVFGLEIWAEAEVTKAQDVGDAGTTTNNEGTPQQ